MVMGGCTICSQRSCEPRATGAHNIAKSQAMRGQAGLLVRRRTAHLEGRKSGHVPIRWAHSTRAAPQKMKTVTRLNRVKMQPVVHPVERGRQHARVAALVRGRERRWKSGGEVCAGTRPTERRYMQLSAIHQGPGLSAGQEARVGFQGALIEPRDAVAERALLAKCPVNPCHLTP